MSVNVNASANVIASVNECVNVNVSANVSVNVNASVNAAGHKHWITVGWFARLTFYWGQVGWSFSVSRQLCNRVEEIQSFIKITRAYSFPFFPLFFETEISFSSRQHPLALYREKVCVMNEGKKTNKTNLRTWRWASRFHLNVSYAHAQEVRSVCACFLYTELLSFKEKQHDDDDITKTSCPHESRRDRYTHTHTPLLHAI